MHYYRCNYHNNNIDDNLKFENHTDFLDNFNIKKSNWEKSKLESINEIKKTYNKTDKESQKEYKRSIQIINSKKYETELLNFYNISFSWYHSIFSNKENSINNHFTSFIIPYVSIIDNIPIIRYTSLEYISNIIDNYIVNQTEIISFDEIYNEVILKDEQTSKIFNKEIFNSFYYYVNPLKKKKNSIIPNYIDLRIFRNYYSDGYKTYSYLLLKNEKKEIIKNALFELGLFEKIQNNTEITNIINEYYHININDFENNNRPDSIINLNTIFPTINQSKDLISNKKISTKQLVLYLYKLGYLDYTTKIDIFKTQYKRFEFIADLINCSPSTLEKYYKKFKSSDKIEKLEVDYEDLVTNFIDYSLKIHEFTELGIKKERENKHYELFLNHLLKT
ncbi:hypothetical protein HX096_09960 [Empedobacter falsenii]|uniref:hypothetical protein n=1 Tax=Empedobacter falsenii TaxID=343874 RepID=UPI0025757E98|nr:hypothetical protein [Empedobacter falsenii]MDM1548175.1 hypothetical protein [Empedobacter falsenii]